MDQELASTSQGDRSGRNVRRRLIPPLPISSVSSEVPQSTAVHLRSDVSPRGSRTLPRSMAPRRRGHRINNTQRPLPHFLTAPTSRQNLVDTTADHSNTTQRPLRYSPVILTAPSSGHNLVDSAADQSPNQEFTSSSDMDQELASTSQGGRSGRNVRRRLIPPPPIQARQRPATLPEPRGSQPRGSRTLPRSMAPSRRGHHINNTQRPLCYSPVILTAPSSRHNLVDSAAHQSPNQELSGSSDMDREHPSMSQGDRSGRNVRRRLIPPPPVQARHRPTALQEPRGSQPRIQPTVSNENTHHHLSPSSTLGETISGSSGPPHGLQPLTASTSARGHERRRSLQSAQHYRVSSVSSELPQSTAVHLRRDISPRGSRTLPPLMAPRRRGHRINNAGRPLPVFITAPTSRQNLVDTGADHSRNQNPEILTGRHPDMFLDINHMSYEQLLELEEMIGKVSRGIKTSELHQFVKKVICCGEQDKDEICVICQEQYGDEDVIGQLKCSHEYHYSCIGKWMKQQAVCPICRCRAAPL